VRFLARLILGVAALALVAEIASAQSPPYAYPRTVGTSPAQVLPANAARKVVIFANPSATATVAVCPAQDRITSANITCAVNGAGSITLLPYDRITISAGSPPYTIPSAWNAVASGGGSPLTILEFE
jgi:hypothetical protein